MLTRYILQLVGSLGFMFYLNAALTGVLLAVVPFVSIMAVQYGKILTVGRSVSLKYFTWVRCGVMRFNATFNNISVISVEVSFIGGGNQRTRSNSLTCRKSLTTLYYIMLYWVHLAWAGLKLTMLVVIGTDWTGSCKSNYHTAMAAPTHSPQSKKLIQCICDLLFQLILLLFYCDFNNIYKSNLL